MTRFLTLKLTTGTRERRRQWWETLSQPWPPGVGRFPAGGDL